MTSYLIDISGHALIEAEAIKLVHVRRNVTPFRCPDTGKLHHAHIAVETWHDVYRIPFDTIADARAVFADIVTGIKAQRRSVAEAADARRRIFPRGSLHDGAPSGRLAERGCGPATEAPAKSGSQCADIRVAAE